MPALALALSAAGCSIGANPAASESSPTAPPKNDWIETQMFFGLTEGNTRIPDDQWHDFIDKSVTPRFPDGFTILYGDGQYRASNNEIHKEPCAVLIILYQTVDHRRDDGLLNAIAQDYDRRFHQESVLRSDSAARAEFISMN